MCARVCACVRERVCLRIHFPVLTISKLVYLCLRPNVSIKHFIKTRTVMFDMHFKSLKGQRKPFLNY